MKMQEVRELAKKRGINSFGKSKANLIREIQRAEGNFDCFGTAEQSCDQTACIFRADCLPGKTPAAKRTTKKKANGPTKAANKKPSAKAPRKTKPKDAV